MDVPVKKKQQKTKLLSSIFVVVVLVRSVKIDSKHFKLRHCLKSMCTHNGCWLQLLIRS